MFWLRRVGVALGSLLAAGLCVGVAAAVLSLFMSLTWVVLPLVALVLGVVGGALQPGIVGGLITFGLGALIYRDIVRRDPVLGARRPS